MAQVELRVVEVELGGLDLGGLEEVVDMPEQHPGVAEDHLELVSLGIVGGKVGQEPLGGRQDQRQRGPQLMADVGEEVRLQPVELLQPRVQGGQLLVGLFEVATEVRRLPGPAYDLGLHDVEAVGLGTGRFLELAPDVLGDILDGVHDGEHRAVGRQHGRVDDAPEPLLEPAAGCVGARDVVFLNRHGVGGALAQHASERRREIARPLGGGVVRVVGEDLEHGAAHHGLPLRQRGTEIRVTGGHDDEVRVDDEILLGE